MGGGLNGDGGGFLIADFADHHHVRVLTKQRAQGGGKRHADLLMHLDLRGRVQMIFNRVLNGADVQPIAVHAAE